MTLIALSFAAACGSGTQRAPTDGATASGGASIDTSSSSFGEAVTHLQSLVRGLAAAALPGGQWAEHLPDSGDDLGGAIDVCQDDRGNDTDFKIVPYTMTATYDTAASDAENAALLQRARDFLEGQGLQTTLSTPIGSAGRVAGRGDGFVVSIELPTRSQRIVAAGNTPCVR